MYSPLLRSLALFLVLGLFAACDEPQDPDMTTGVTADTLAAVDTMAVDGAARYASTQEVFEGEPDVDAAAILRPTSAGSAEGYATFEGTGDGIRVRVRLQGLEPGSHGFHVHENGSCADGEDGTPAGAAGGHFAPMDSPHGGPDDPAEQRHVGDFGNLEVGSDGMVDTTFEDDVATLEGERGIVGRALMVHAGEDDLESQPSGDSGDRVACGIIEAR